MNCNEGVLKRLRNEEMNLFINLTVVIVSHYRKIKSG